MKTKVCVERNCDDEMIAVCGGMSSYHTWAHIRRVVAEKGFNVSLHDATHQMGILSLQGPNR